MEKNKGAREPGVGKRGRNAVARDDHVKLSDLNINKSQSSRWQKLADIGDDEFEDVVTHAQHKATAAVDQAQQPKPKSPKSPKPPKAPKRPDANSGDPIAACLRQVRPVLRDTIAGLDAKGRLVLLDELRKDIRTIITEVTAREAETDHWAETAH
jgi:hypothetical protein